MWQKYSLRGFSVLLRCAQPQNIFFALIHMYLCTCSKHTVPFKLPVNVDFIQAVKVTKSTVPLKCKLKVSTRFSILDSRSSKISRIKNLVSRLKFRVRFSRFENQVSRIEFRGTWSIFQGSWTEISRKWFNLQKLNNSDEQNNWHVALFVQTLCWMLMYAIFFMLCIFYNAYLHWSWWQQTSLASICIYNVSCQSEWLFCATSTRSESVNKC